MQKYFLLLAAACLSFPLLSDPVGVLGQPGVSSLKAFQFAPRKGPSEEQPGTRKDGGTRGDCLPAGAQLHALTPMEQEMVEIAPGLLIPDRTFVVGDAVSESPTLWFYLTQPLPQETLTVEVQTEAKQSIYRKQVTLPEWAGLVGVPLPNGSLKDSQGLYRWTADIQVNCTEDPAKPYSETLKVEGWIQRVSEPVIDAETSNAEAAVEYAAAGVWFDTLNLLIELYQADPKNADIQAAWEHLMSAVELEVPATAIP